MVSVLSLFSTKKTPTPAADNEGQMMLAAMESLMYTLWLLSVRSRQRVRASLRWRHAPLQFNDVVIGMMKTSLKSWYSDRTLDNSEAGCRQTTV